MTEAEIFGRPISSAMIQTTDTVWQTLYSTEDHQLFLLDSCVYVVSEKGITIYPESRVYEIFIAKEEPT